MIYPEFDLSYAIAKSLNIEPTLEVLETIKKAIQDYLTCTTFCVTM